MGLFDRFRRGSAPPPAPPPPGDRPAVPIAARIDAFDPLDAVGTLRVTDGSPLRFGRSACKKFEPVVGAEVIVGEVAPHPMGGWRATRIELDPQAGPDYDRLLAERDAGLGVRPPADPIEAAASACEVLGWITVLLDRAPPVGPQALIRWAIDLGLPERGIRIDFEREPRLGIGGVSALAYLGHGPFPRRRLDELGLPADFDPGQGFIGLGLGTPGHILVQRQVLAGDVADPWGEHGRLRALSRIVVALLDHGPGVILPHAMRFSSADLTGARLGRLDDPACRPFPAWIGWSIAPELGRYLTRGMVLHGLPDVSVDADPDDTWELNRSREAILYACHRMVRTNQPLADGEPVDVPVGIGIGAYPIDPVTGDVERYRAVTTEAGIRLERTEDAQRLPARWRQTIAGGEPQVAFNTYRELFLDAASAALDAGYETQLDPEPEPGVPAFEVDVLRADDDRGFYVITNGVGRIAQPGGDPEGGTAHVELVAAMSTHHPAIASILATIAGELHRHRGGDSVFKPGDTVSMEVVELAAAGFVLGRCEPMTLAAGGPPVFPIELIPVNAIELQKVRRHGSGPWLEAQGEMDPVQRGPRWQLR